MASFLISPFVRYFFIYLFSFSFQASLIPPGAEFPTRGLFHSLSSSPGGSLQVHPPQDSRDDEEEDRRSFISKKSIKGQGRITKKEKMKMRHDKWLQSECHLLICSSQDLGSQRLEPKLFVENFVRTV